MDKPQTIKELRSVYDMISLKGKKALVTGAAGGIGRSTAAAFAELGADVALMDIPARENDLCKHCEDISERFGTKAIYVTGDVSDEASVKNFVGDVVNEFSTINIVHNNAGLGVFGDNSDISLDDWNKVVAINQTGILLVGRECANLMKKHKHGGSIINTSSISGIIINRLPRGNRYGVAYPATKAAVKHITNAMAMDYLQYNIRFNSVSFGYILSGIHDGMPPEAFEGMKDTTPMMRMGRLDESVGCVVFLASELSSFATGSNLVVDGGYCVW